MDSKRQYQKRNRPVTACFECQRRKQKCDRERPCGQCAARNASYKCAFANDNGAPRASDNGQHVPDDDFTDSISVAGRLGYASLSEVREALDTLQLESQNKTKPQGPEPHKSAGAASQHVNFGKRRPLSTGLRTKYDNCVACLPSRHVTDMLLSLFFSDINWYFTVVDQPYFMSMYQAWDEDNARRRSPRSVATADKKRGLDTESSPAELLYFTAVLLQVLALTLQFLPSASPVRELLDIPSLPASDRLSRIYSDAGVEVMFLLGRHESTTSAILVDLLRCAWLKNTGRGNEAWFSLGDAVRQAQNLGLHLQNDIGSDPGATLHLTQRCLWYNEHRRHLWASLFAWDSHMALMLGRSRMINAADCTVSPPSNCDFPADPSNTVPALTTNFGNPSNYTSQLVKYASGSKIHQMLSAGVLSHHCKDYDLVMKFHREILEILDSLPPTHSPRDPDTTWDTAFPHISKQRQHISIIINANLLALHRPHAWESSFSWSAGIHAALNTLTAQQALFELLQEHQYRVHSLVFHNLDAAMFLKSVILRRKAGKLPGNLDDKVGLPLEEICSALCQAADRLEKSKARSAVAGAGAMIIRYCLTTIRRSTQHDHVEPQIEAKMTSKSLTSGTNISGVATETACAHSRSPSAGKDAVTPESGYCTTSPVFGGDQDCSPSAPLESRVDKSTGLPATGNELNLDFVDMVNWGNLEEPTSPFGGLQFDVDVQTAVWMEQIGIQENTFDDPELNGVT